MSLVRRILPTGEFFRFLVAGGWNTAVGYGVFAGLFYVLSAHVHYFVILALATVINVTISFISYKLFVFRTKGNYLREYVRFYGVYAVPIVLSFVLFPALVEILKLNPYLAQAIVLAITVVVSFFGHKHFSFAKRSLAGQNRPSQ